jgi:hypothetical protein
MTDPADLMRRAAELTGTRLTMKRVSRFAIGF